jgi:hypothetical protein
MSNYKKYGLELVDAGLRADTLFDAGQAETPTSTDLVRARAARKGHHLGSCCSRRP